MDLNVRSLFYNQRMYRINREDVKVLPDGVFSEAASSENQDAQQTKSAANMESDR